MKSGGTIRVAVLVHRIGPYHHARFVALALRCNLTVVEYSSIDRTYAWNAVAVNEYPVERLFMDADVADKPVREIAERMARALDRIRPDVVAVPGWSEPASVSALAWCRKSGTKAVVMSESTREDALRRPWKEWIKARIVAQYSAALVGGTRHVDYAIELGMPRERVFLGYDVVDNAHFAAGAESARENASVMRARHELPERYFLASSRFVAKKNLGGLIDAYAAYGFRAGQGAWHLVVLGEGDLRFALEARIASLRLASRVHLPGFVQYGELPVYYGLAEAFIHASTVEQWGLVVNEAMAASLPVLVSDRCGCATDLVSDGVNGFRFDPLDVGELAARMARFAAGAYDLPSMGHASRQIIAKFAPETFADQLCTAARAALSAPAPRAFAFDRFLVWAASRR